MSLRVRFPEPNFRKSVSVFCLLALLLLGWWRLDDGEGVDGPVLPDRQVGRFAERMLYFLDGYAEGGAGWRIASGYFFEGDIEAEVLQAYCRLERDGMTDQERVQYAIVLEAMGRGGEARRQLAEAGGGDYAEFAAALAALWDGRILSSGQREVLDEMVAFNDSWWSGRVGRWIGLATGLQQERGDTMFRRMVVLQSVALLLPVAALVVYVRCRRHPGRVVDLRWFRLACRPSLSDLIQGGVRFLCMAPLLAAGGYALAGLAGVALHPAVYALVETLYRSVPVIWLVSCLYPSTGFALRAFGWRCGVLGRRGFWKILALCWLAISLGDTLLIWAAGEIGGLSVADFLTEEILEGTAGYFAADLWLSVVVASFAEEVLMRGVVYSVLRRGIGVAPAIVVSSFGFTVLHAYSPFGMLSVFLSGCLFALAYERTGSLAAPVLLHAFTNLLAVLSAWYFFGMPI